VAVSAEAVARRAASLWPHLDERQAQRLESSGVAGSRWSPGLPGGKAIPYGVYDVAANTGWVSVGRDHDTSAFADSTLRRWWASVGHIAYPTADRLLICADGGASNGYRVRAWKTELAALARETVDSPRDRPDHHGLPPATRHQQMEPD